jgi:excisionase family DNA binding protein
MTQDKLMTPAETAEYLGIPVETLTQWRCKKRESLPYLKIGRHVRYKPEDVREWCNTKRVS